MKKLKCNIGEYGVIVNQQRKFLILKLAKNEKFKKELWMLPGGRLHEGDMPEQGLRREVLEETGLKIKVINPVHVASWGNKVSTKYAVFFLCKSIGKENVKISREHIEGKWINFKDIEKIPWHNINSKLAVKKADNLLK